MPRKNNSNKRTDSISLFDRAGAALAEKAATRWSRRSAVVRLAQATAGLFGIAFAASFIVDSGFRVNAQNDPNAQPDGCKQDKTKGGRCGAAGIWCALRGRSCDHFTGCPNCLQTTGAIGCPTGTRLGGGWSACCLCTSELTKPSPRKGKVYTFNDCCGFTTAVCSPCNVVVPGWHHACSNSRCPVTQNWCTGHSGLYVCSIAAQDPGDGGGDCTENNNNPPTN